MKFGMRTSSVKKSLSGRTTGKLTRTMKKAVNPTYGRKGMGLINDPKKAIYNKVYNKTTVGIGDVLSDSNSYDDSDMYSAVYSESNINNKRKSKYDDGKYFFERVWFIVVLAFIFPLVSLIILLVNKHITKKNKIIWGSVLGVWNLCILIAI